MSGGTQHPVYGVSGERAGGGGGGYRGVSGGTQHPVYGVSGERAGGGGGDIGVCLVELNTLCTV